MEPPRNPLTIAQDPARRAENCVKALEGVADPRGFMRNIRDAMRHLGKAEAALHGQDLHIYMGMVLADLRKASNAAGGFEEYT